LTKNNPIIVWSSGNLFSSQKENHEKPYHDAKYFKIFFFYKMRKKEFVLRKKQKKFAKNDWNGSLTKNT
jgi:hypothetical protein